jgi:hypothetical protein
MPTPIDHDHKLHSLYMHEQPLGVECTACGRRATAFAGQSESFKGDMTVLRSLRFKCTACGGRTWTGWLFAAGEAEAWIEGQLVVSKVDGSRPRF